MTQSEMETTDWSPERKIVGAAVAVLILAILTPLLETWGVDLIPGAEGALAVIVAYFLPNKK